MYQWPLNRKRSTWDELDTHQALTMLGGIGLGLAAMYLLDPDRGNRRRAALKDATTRTLHKTGDAIGTTSRDLANRTQGLIAQLTSLCWGEEVSDEVLEARVRAKLGRVVSHPSAIEVRAERGRVTLSGPVLGREVADLLSCVSGVRGVTEVENRLEVHGQAGDVPDLQGGVRRPSNRFELMQENWSPAARLLVGASGGALIAYALQRRDEWGAGLGLLGCGLLLRSTTNLEMKRLLGVGGGRRAVDIHKTININAPVGVVYDFWNNYENFPRFMSHVREVQDRGNGCSHWVVDGPAGVPVEWDAVITKQVPEQVLAWKSVPDSAIAQAGIIRFDANADGSTRVDIRFSYNPPAGAVGHAVAALFGAHPKREMDEDLVRMKTLIEGGNPPRDAAVPAPSSFKAVGKQ